MWFVTLMRVVKFLLSFRLKVNVIGKENIPEEGPVIVCFNHTDILDPLYIMFALMRDMWALVASSYSKNIIIRFFSMTGKAILVDRNTTDMNALNKSIEVLKTGKFLGVSPKGTRSKDGLLHKGKFGLGYLAGMTDSTILPLGLVGSFGASIRMLKQSLMKKVEVTVNIGKPFKLKGIDDLKKDLPQGSTEEDKKNTMIFLRKCRDVTNSQIMPSIADLLPKEMRGDFE